MNSLNHVSVTQTHDTSDSSSSAFSILSERAFTPRITGKLHRVLSTSVIKFRASERDERHCCLVRPCETRERIPNNTLGSVHERLLAYLSPDTVTGDNGRHPNRCRGGCWLKWNMSQCLLRSDTVIYEAATQRPVYELLLTFYLANRH